jgi:hypothetical protein
MKDGFDERGFWGMIWAAEEALQEGRKKEEGRIQKF